MNEQGIPVSIEITDRGRRMIERQFAENDERLRHRPYEDDTTAVTGIRWCVVCDELWPCDVRRGRVPA